MLCTYCRTENKNYHIYCYNCGKRLDESDNIDLSEEILNDEILIDFNDLSMTNSKDNNNSLKLESLDDNITDDQQSKVNRIEESTPSDEELCKDDERIIQIKKDHMDFLNKFGSSITDDEEFDLYLRDKEEDEVNTTLSLKRNYRRENKRKILAPIFISIILICIVSLFFLVKAINPRKPKDNVTDSTAKIIATINRESSLVNGTPSQRFTISSSRGEHVKILDYEAEIENGIAQIIIEDMKLFNLFSDDSESDSVQVSLKAIVTAKNLKDIERDIQFKLRPVKAPLKLTNIDSNTSTKENSFTVNISIDPNSVITINDTNYSNSIDENGNVTVELQLSNIGENNFDINVSSEGYIDNSQNFVITRLPKDFSLVINQEKIVDTLNDWVEISGKTDQSVKLDVNLETQEPLLIDSSGNFSFKVKPVNIGYTLCSITAKCSDGNRGTQEVIINNLTDIQEYSTTAWKINYNEFVTSPQLHNGQHYTFTGTVSKIENKDNYAKMEIILADNNKPVIVEYYGDDLNKKAGNNVRIYANKWGMIDKKPRFLAAFVN